MTEPGEPGWKRNGRSGPLDWWITCNEHGYIYRPRCLSCQIVEAHNNEFADLLRRECEGAETKKPPAA